MGEEKISVIVPVYNVERYLSACLESILSQSYKNLEVIVINDGSTDFSLKIAEQFAEKDDRVRVFTFDNAGPAEARNQGLKLATGKYISFVDSDDLLLPDALEILMNTLLHYNAKIVEGLSIRGTVYTPPKNKPRILIKVYSSEEALADMLYQKNLLSSAWGKLFSAELFENFSFKKGLLYEDLNLVYQILEKTDKLVWINYPVYFYRNTEGSILNTWKPQRLDVLKVTEDIEKYVQQTYPGILKAAIDRRLSANFNMFILSSLNGNKENADKCWQHIKKNRKISLFNPKVRLKNKAGVLLSYLGKPLFNFATRKIYK